ncbi:MAG: AIM24 family protein, partial [Polyangiaceae bacterium]|nr:AIM24 family protein [Polyangiaceae bacterium]
MQIDIGYRPGQSMARVTLAPGESVIAESGAMIGMSTNVQMQTTSGGVLSGLKRMIGGEPF